MNLQKSGDIHLWFVPKYLTFHNTLLLIQQRFIECLVKQGTEQ